MKYLVSTLFFLLTSAYTSTPNLEEKTPICDDSICVIQFNAGFNAANEVKWLDNLTDCSTATVDIMEDPSLPQDYKIVVVLSISQVKVSHQNHQKDSYHLKLNSLH